MYICFVSRENIACDSVLKLRIADGMHDNRGQFEDEYSDNSDVSDDEFYKWEDGTQNFIVNFVFSLTWQRFLIFKLFSWL